MEAPDKKPLTIALVEDVAVVAFLGVSLKPIRTVVAMGLVPIFPFTKELGVVDTPDLLKIV